MISMENDDLGKVEESRILSDLASMDVLLYSIIRESLATVGEGVY